MRKLTKTILLCGLALPLALSYNLALAQEGELAKPIKGIISLEEVKAGKIAVRQKGGYSIAQPVFSEVSPILLPLTKSVTASSAISWVSSDFMVFKEYPQGAAVAWDFKNGQSRLMISHGVRNIHSFTESAALVHIKENEYRMLEAKEGELTVRDTDYMYKVPSAKEAYYDKFKLCESFGKMFDFKLSSKSKVVCYDGFSFKRYSVEKDELVELPKFKMPIDWDYFQKNYFVDAMNSPNGGYYLKDGILYAPLYREGREVWEPLTDKPTEAFTPISGMKVKGGAILKDAVYSDRGVCGRDGYSQAFWLKTNKGEQLLHINTPESFWHLKNVSPDGCKVALFDYANNWPDCFGNKGSLKVLDVCSLQ